jgi:VIT1/CCC1 family predicted Fe2+/Mn2+ transporter
VGVVDASMYVLGCLTSRNHSYQFVRTLRDDPQSGRQQMAAAMPAVVFQSLSAAEWDNVLASLARIPVPPRARVRRDDVLGGVAIFLLANAALLPLVAPFALISDLNLSQQVSNALALAMLFGCGFKLARYTGERPLKLALGFTVFGCVLVAVTIALGG